VSLALAEQDWGCPDPAPDAAPDCARTPSAVCEHALTAAAEWLIWPPPGQCAAAPSSPITTCCTEAA